MNGAPGALAPHQSYLLTGKVALVTGSGTFGQHKMAHENQKANHLLVESRRIVKQQLTLFSNRPWHGP